MTIEIKHPFTSAKADGPDATKVQATNWNAGHTLTQAAARMLGIPGAVPGSTEEMTSAQVLAFAGGEAAGAAAAAVAAHEAAGDPHSQYLTPAEANAAYDTIGAASAAVAAHEAAADPHTGYQKETEKDAANGYAGVDADGAVLRAKALRETAGPTNLVVGAVADGQFLKRSGAAIVGDPGGGGSGTDHVLLVPTANKTIPANSSLIVGDFFRLDSGIQLLIESGANMTIN